MKIHNEYIHNYRRLVKDGCWGGVYNDINPNFIGCMIENERFNYLDAFFGKEDEKCEWMAFTNLRNLVSGDSGNDVISYVSTFSNMEGGVLIMGVEDKTLKIILI